MGSYYWFLGTSQLIAALLCQKFGGKVVFGFSNMIVGLLACMIPLMAEFGVEAVIVVRALQGLAAVHICPVMPFSCHTFSTS